MLNQYFGEKQKKSNVTSGSEKKDLHHCTAVTGGSSDDLLSAVSHRSCRRIRKFPFIHW